MFQVKSVDLLYTAEVQNVVTRKFWFCLINKSDTQEMRPSQSRHSKSPKSEEIRSNSYGFRILSSAADDVFGTQ